MPTAQTTLLPTALIVIDAQESFAHRPYFATDDVPDYLAAQNRLIEGFEAAGLPIVRVYHVQPDPTGTDPFSLESGLVRPLEGLRDFTAAVTVHKTRHSALVGSGLDVWLQEHGVRRLVISGIRTEQCCETTTRHASDLGWDVIYVPDATLTFAMTLPDGSRFAPADIRARTATVLQDRFAQVMDAESALAAVAPQEPVLAAAA